MQNAEQVSDLSHLAYVRLRLLPLPSQVQRRPQLKQLFSDPMMRVIRVIRVRHASVVCERVIHPGQQLCMTTWPPVTLTLVFDGYLYLWILRLLSSEAGSDSSEAVNDGIGFTVGGQVLACASSLVQPSHTLQSVVGIRVT